MENREKKKSSIQKKIKTQVDEADARIFFQTFYNSHSKLLFLLFSH